MPQTFYDSSAKPIGLYRILIDVWGSRYLIWLLGRNEIFTRYKRSVLGLIWSFLNPALTAGVIYFVFGKIFHGYLPNNRGYAAYVFSGILLQTLLINSISLAAQSITANAPMLLRMRVAPRTLIIASGLAQVMHFAIGVIGLFPIMFIYKQVFSLRMLLLPVYMLFALFAFAGISMLISGLFIKFDDTSYLLSASLMILSYLTPLLYPINILEGKLLRIVELNPLTTWVQTFRWLISQDSQINLVKVIGMCGLSLLIFFGGLLYIEKKWPEFVMYL